MTPLPQLDDYDVAVPAIKCTLTKSARTTVNVFSETPLSLIAKRCEAASALIVARSVTSGIQRAQ